MSSSATGSLQLLTKVLATTANCAHGVSQRPPPFLKKTIMAFEGIEQCRTVIVFVRHFLGERWGAAICRSSEKKIVSTWIWVGWWHKHHVSSPVVSPAQFQEILGWKPVSRHWLREEQPARRPPQLLLSLQLSNKANRLSARSTKFKKASACRQLEPEKSQHCMPAASHG